MTTKELQLRENLQLADEMILDTEVGTARAPISDLTKVLNAGNLKMPGSDETISEHYRQLCNKNLLINAYLARPVNQRGQTEYTGSGYMIDRWKSSQNGIVKIKNGYVEFFANASGTAWFEHLMEHERIPVGSMFTASALLFDGTLLSVTGVVPQPSTTSVLIGTCFVNESNGIGIYQRSADFLFQFQATAGSSFGIVACKLELGPNQTLAHKEGSVWVLNEIPDYATELAKCQRYQLEIPTGSQAVCQRVLNNMISFFMPTPVSFRANPKMTGEFVVRSGSNNIHTGFTFEYFKKPNGIIITCTKTAHGITINDSPILVCDSAGMLDANL